MNEPRTAAILIGSDTSRMPIEVSLRRLGFAPLALADPTQNSPYPDMDCITACDLLVADESNASLLLSKLPNIKATSYQRRPAVVMVRDAAARVPEVSDLEVDGILTLPLRIEETVARLEAIAYSHRVQQERILPLLSELGMVQRVMKSVTNGITIADATFPDLPLIYVNPAFEKMTGYSFDEVCGQNCRFLQGLDTHQPGLVQVREAIREQRDTMTVLRNYRKDGTPFWNELYLSALRDEQGRVTHFVGIQSDVTLRIEFGERLAFLAHHDSLTGLANRELLFERLGQAVRRASRHGHGVALIFFDLDNFKHVNDAFGHDAGDALLRTVSERLQKEVREYDTVARLGGDEFVILLPDLEHEEEIPALIHRIREQIAETIILREEAFNPSASVGWSLYPRDGHDLEQLLKIADFAMYADKHQRRHVEEESDSSSEAGSGDSAT